MKQAHYLTIHFAPSTACIAVEINESQFRQLRDAMDKHSGEINLRVSASAEVVLGLPGGTGGRTEMNESRTVIAVPRPPRTRRAV